MKAPLRRAWAFVAHTLAAYLPFWIVTASFVASRLVYRLYYRCTFDFEPITYFIQYIPIWLLKHDFWRSVLYLHDQSPLQNVVAGGLWVTLGQERAEVVLDGLYLACGLGMALALLASLRRLGASSWIATLGVSLFIASPVAMLYESWLFYHEPVVLCFALGLYALLRHYESGAFRWALLFFALLAVAALFRSIYGPLWVSAIAAALLVCPPARRAPARALGSRARRWLASRTPRQTIVLAALVPTLVVGANVLRTPILMGRSFGSGMAWANIPIKIWGYVPGTERTRLKEEHLVSDAAEHEPWATDGSGNPAVPIPPQEPTGVPLLDMAVTPDGQSNSHSLAFLAVIETYYEPEGKYLLEHERQAYVESVIDSARDWYCSSPTRDIILYRSGNTKRVGHLLDALEGKGSRSQSLRALQFGLPITFLYGVYQLIRARVRAESERSRTAALLFMMLTILYAGAGTLLVSYGDFSRYRYEVDGFYFAMFALLVTDVVRGIVRSASWARAFVRRRRAVAAANSLVPAAS